MNVNILDNLKQNKMQGKGTEKQARISFILVLCIFALLLATAFVGCSKEDNYNTGVDIRRSVTKRVWVSLPKPNIELNLDSRLKKDPNGYSVFNLYSIDKQNFHRISGNILIDGKIPKPSQGASWESNLYWWINKNDTIVNVTKTYLNQFNGQLTIIQLPPLLSNMDAIVPTINSNSQSDILTGEINTIIAPIWEMKGDTMIVMCKVKYYYPYETDGISEKYKSDSIIKVQKIILK